MEQRMAQCTQERLAQIARCVTQVEAAVCAAAKRAGRDREEITLLAATKTRTPEEIRAVLAAGADGAGENRVQELRDKLPTGAYGGCVPHFIGVLQSNKVKYLIGNVAMIHSVDSLHLAREIGRLSCKAGVVTDVLMEVNLAGEATKSGVDLSQAPETAQAIAAIPGVRLRGLMTVPPYGGDNRRWFAGLRELQERLATDLPAGFDVLSMGMSQDFETAIEEGATIVRLGTALFGPRNYGNKNNPVG